MNAKSSNDENNVRDKYMAENVAWIYNHTNHNKMMIWAHNEHIGKVADNNKLQRMGMLLAELFKDQYYAFGFDFNSGKFSGGDPKTGRYVVSTIPYAKPGSSGALFAQCNTANFILDFKTASANPDINKFLNSKLTSIFIGASSLQGKAPHYSTHKLADTYDGIIFIRETSPSIAMDK